MNQNIFLTYWRRYSTGDWIDNNLRTTNKTLPFHCVFNHCNNIIKYRRTGKTELIGNYIRGILNFCKAIIWISLKKLENFLEKKRRISRWFFTSFTMEASEMFFCLLNEKLIITSEEEAPRCFAILYLFYKVRSLAVLLKLQSGIS